jgi:glucosamine--fructose-6-phosphate aminotransferase (isomerizing)
VVPKLTGSYALLVIATGEDRIIAARYASPLVLGVGDGEFFAASDMMPILDHTERAVYLEDGDIASISSVSVEIFHEGQAVKRPVELINWSQEDTKKGGFPHYMLKEIFEQPQAFYNSVRAVRSDSLPEPIRDPGFVTVILRFSSMSTYLQISSRGFRAIPGDLTLHRAKYFSASRGLVIDFTIGNCRYHICT